MDIGFCGGKWSEKACYHIGELVFGFDDINNNMVSMELFSIQRLVHSMPSFISTVRPTAHTDIDFFLSTSVR